MSHVIANLWIEAGRLCIFFTYYAMLQCSKFNLLCSKLQAHSKLLFTGTANCKAKYIAMSEPKKGYTHSYIARYW